MRWFIGWFLPPKKLKMRWFLPLSQNSRLDKAASSSRLKQRKMKKRRKLNNWVGTIKLKINGEIRTSHLWKKYNLINIAYFWTSPFWMAKFSSYLWAFQLSHSHSLSLSLLLSFSLFYFLHCNINKGIHLSMEFSAGSVMNTTKCRLIVPSRQGQIQCQQVLKTRRCGIMLQVLWWDGPWMQACKYEKRRSWGRGRLKRWSRIQQICNVSCSFCSQKC